jgi:DNA-binding PadR family transcriptional regulator
MEREEIDEALEDLIRRGLVEALVREDGEIVYQLNPKLKDEIRDQLGLEENPQEENP